MSLAAIGQGASYEFRLRTWALLRDVVLAPLSRVGPAPRIQANMVSGLTGAPLARLGLARPDFAALRR